MCNWEVPLYGHCLVWCGVVWCSLVWCNGVKEIIPPTVPSNNPSLPSSRQPLCLTHWAEVRPHCTLPQVVAGRHSLYAHMIDKYVHVCVYPVRMWQLMGCVTSLYGGYYWDPAGCPV